MSNGVELYGKYWIFGVRVVILLSAVCCIFVLGVPTAIGAACLLGVFAFQPIGSVWCHRTEYMFSISIIQMSFVAFGSGNVWYARKKKQE